MYKIGVVGDSDSIFIFKSLGVDIFPCQDEGEARLIIDRLAMDSYAVIFVTENVAKDIMGTIDRYRKKYIPSIVLIPGSSGSLGIGLEKINDNVERAIGVNIL